MSVSRPRTDPALAFPVVPLLRPVAVALGLALALSGCAGSSSGAASGQPPSRTPSPTPSPCPPPSGGLAAWPAGFPTDLPRPPGAKVSSKVRVTNGVRVVQLETPTSLRESVLFIVRELPKAGYVLGRGDAEPREADAPFVKGTIRGAIRLGLAAQCRTLWVVAVVDLATRPGNTSPLLPTYHPSASPSPLPFG